MIDYWQAIRTIYEMQKIGGVDDLSLVRFPWQLFYLRVSSTKFLLKTAKNGLFETLFQICASPSPHILRTFGFFNFPAISYLSNLNYQNFG